MKYGYARVSTDNQNADMQSKALQRAGSKRVFKDEGLSGATTKRLPRSELPATGGDRNYRHASSSGIVPQGLPTFVDPSLSVPAG